VPELRVGQLDEEIREELPPLLGNPRVGQVPGEGLGQVADTLLRVLPGRRRRPVRQVDAANRRAIELVGLAEGVSQIVNHHERLALALRARLRRSGWVRGATGGIPTLAQA